MGADGFIPVDEVLKQKEFAGVSLEGLRTLVHRDHKDRFCLHEDTASGKWQIRANLGHSFDVPELALDPFDPQDTSVLVHVTFRKYWELIKVQGLRKMQRAHVHFALEHPGHVFPGAKADGDVVIYLNVAKCLEDGIPIFRCGYHLCVSPGLNGVIDPQYFEGVLDRRTRRRLY